MPPFCHCDLRPTSGLGSITHHLSPWKYMYIFGGCITILWAFVILALVPDSPFRLSSAVSGRIFTEADSALLARRAREKDDGEVDGEMEKGTKWKEIGEAARDPMIYVFACMGAAIYVSRSFLVRRPPLCAVPFN